MYKLTETEKRVLAHLEFQPDLTASQVAKLARTKPAQVNYTIRKLRERGIIWRRAFIDPMRMGLQDIGIFFNVAGATPRMRRGIEQHFLDSKRIGWLGILAGEFQYGAIYLCEHLAELGDFLKELSTDFEISLGDKVITPRITYSRFPRRYLLGNTKSLSKFTYRYEKPIAEIDDIDRKILKRLDGADFDSFRSVAQSLSIPQSTLDRRVKNLLHSGVIRGFIYEIDIAKLGVSMSRILVQTRGSKVEIEKLLSLFCSKCPNVSYLVEAMGTWDIELGFETFTSEEDVEVLNSFYEICGPIVGSSRVMRELKDLKLSYMPL
jgi:DNA-binding Lrp family transcriptional regulator